MTQTKAQTGPKRPQSDSRHPDTDARPEEAETEDEKIKREQATKPALMPIGDPAGAA